MDRTIGKLEQHELGRIRAAAVHATKVHPGPTGEVLARELRAHADFGYRFSSDTLIARLIAEILGTPEPADPRAQLLGR